MSKNNNNNNYDLSFKLITIGSSSAEKTEIIKKFVSDNYETKTISTIGFGTFNKELTLKDGTIIRLNIIDTPGQENYQALQISYIKNADGVLFIFSHNDKKSFDVIKGWLAKIKKEVPSIDFKNKIPAYLIGNKSDLKHEIEDDEIEEIKNEYNFYGYIYINSKDNNNIKELFSDMGEILFKIYGKRTKKANVKINKKHKKNNNCNLI